MPTFLEYFEKNKKIYEFKIAIAGEHGSDVKERLKSVLEKFSVETLSAGKKTPIQESPFEFPQLSNTAITHYTVSLRYPTTPNILEEIIGRECKIGVSNVKVRTAMDPINDLGHEQHNKETYTPLLGTNDLGGESAQNQVGNTRVMDLLRELEKDKKERSKETESGKTA
jgi:hypothetical protein